MSRPLLAYFGHHKCASTWIHRILAEIARPSGWKHVYLHNPRQFDGNLSKYVRRTRLDLLSYVNADIDQVRDLPRFRGFHVVRDPRDLIVSAYYSHLKSHPTNDWPELAEHRARLQDLSKKAGLSLEMEFSAPVLDQIRRWDYTQPNVLELRQEELTASPYKGFLEICDFLGILDSREFTKWRRLGHEVQAGWNAIAARPGLPLPGRKLGTFPAERLLSIVYGHRFDKLSGGRSRGDENAASHYRSGVPGDWKRHFDAELLQRFKARFGDIVLELGYETDADW